MMNEQKSLHAELVHRWAAAALSLNAQEAFSLEAHHYNEIVKKHESLSLWDAWQRETRSVRESVTAQVERLRPARSSSSSHSVRLAVVFPNFSGLAHETQLARAIAYLRKTTEIELYVIYGFGQPSAEVGNWASNLYSTPNICFLEARDIVDVSNKLNMLDASYSFKCILYPSIYYFAFWASLGVSHPNQKFLRMKYHPLQVGRFTAYGGGRTSDDIYHVVNGEKWVQLSVLGVPVGENQSTRSLDSERIRFGSISRIEKTTSLEYQNFVLKMLASHSEVEYIYAGRDADLDLLMPALRSHPRASYLGWVDPSRAINDFSIYLEPFPWGGGEMSLLALSRGIPCLSLNTYENNVVGIHGFLRYLAGSGGDEWTRFSLCETIDELESSFNLLVNSSEARFLCGEAWSKVVHGYVPKDAHAWCSFLLG